jgi:Holliday junction resolvasome RuvABC endonuclease subunit
MRILGVDPSMNGTGFVVMDLDDDYNVSSLMLYGVCTTKKWCIETDRVQVFHTGSKYTSKNIYDREDITNDIISSKLDGVDVCAMEDFAYDVVNGGNQISNTILQLAEFIGSMRKSIYNRGIPIYRFPPTTVKAFATNSGGASKYMMLLAFKQKFPELFPPEIETDLKLDASPQTDINDAFWMAETLRCRLAYENSKLDDEEIIKKLTTSASKNSGAIMDIIPETPIV